MEGVMKNYTIVREENYVSSGCSCCEPWDMGIYFVELRGERINRWDEYDGTFYPAGFGTKEDALDFILEQNKINVEYKD